MNRRVLATAVALALGPGGDRRVTPGHGPVRMPNLVDPYRACKKGNVVCALEWAPVGEFLEPAMFLIAYPPVLGGKGYVIPLSRIALYVDENGRETPALPKAAHNAALRMGLDTTEPTINLICDVVMASVEDLRTMPKAPPKPH